MQPVKEHTFDNFIIDKSTQFAVLFFLPENPWNTRVLKLHHKQTAVTEHFP